MRTCLQRKINAYVCNKTVDFNSRIQFNSVRRFGVAELNYYFQRCNFLEYCKLSLAKKTYQGYKSTLKIFGEWLENDLPITAITCKMIVDYTVFLAKKKEFSKIYINSHIVALKSFFYYLIDKEIIETSPVEKIKSIWLLLDLHLKQTAKVKYLFIRTTILFIFFFRFFQKTKKPLSL